MLLRQPVPSWGNFLSNSVPAIRLVIGLLFVEERGGSRGTRSWATTAQAEFRVLIVHPFVLRFSFEYREEVFYRVGAGLSNAVFFFDRSR